MIPEWAADLDETLATFQDHQARLGTLVEMLPAHNKRHLWLIRELQERSDLPSDA